MHQPSTKRKIGPVGPLVKAARAVAAVVDRVDDPASTQARTIYEIVAKQAIGMCMGAGVTPREASLILGLTECEVARLLDPKTAVPQGWALSSYTRTPIVAGLQKAWAAA